MDYVLSFVSIAILLLIYHELRQVRLKIKASPNFNDEKTYQKALSILKQNGTISAGKLQSELQITFSHAAYVLSRLESEGYIDPLKKKK